jgi:hypothetical protein
LYKRVGGREVGTKSKAKSFNAEALRTQRSAGEKNVGKSNGADEGAALLSSG